MSLGYGTAAPPIIVSSGTGAPVTGTYTAGRLLVDSTGVLYVCYVSGTPGTWAPAGSGTEIAYAETLSNETSTSVTYENFTNSVSIVVPTLSRPVLVEGFAPSVENSSAGAGAFLAIARTQDSSTRGAVFDSGSAAQRGSIYVQWRLAANATGDTYRLQKARRTAAGTATFRAAGTTGLESVISLRATLC